MEAGGGNPSGLSAARTRRCRGGRRLFTDAVNVHHGRGKAVSSWPGPADALLQGPPLIDEPKPFTVSIVLVFRDGQMIGLRSTEMLFREAAVVPLTVLPGRALARETLPDDPSAR